MIHRNNSLHTERCRSYGSHKYIPFTHYQLLRNSYITQWLIVHKRNILIWSKISTPFIMAIMKLSSSFMVSARGISSTTGITSLLSIWFIEAWQNMKDAVSSKQSYLRINGRRIYEGCTPPYTNFFDFWLRSSR